MIRTERHAPEHSMNLMPASLALDHLAHSLSAGGLLTDFRTEMKKYGSTDTDHNSAGQPEEVSRQRGLLNQVGDITRNLQSNGEPCQDDEDKPGDS